MCTTGMQRRNDKEHGNERTKFSFISAESEHQSMRRQQVFPTAHAGKCMCETIIEIGIGYT